MTGYIRMMQKRYIERAVGMQELDSLVMLAAFEERDFFDRNPHLVDSYGNRFIAAALCQGAALQYLGRGYGVNDFDIHFFYSQNPQKPRLSRAIKEIHANVGDFKNVAVDFIKTVVPVTPSPAMQPIELLRAFLLHAPTDNAEHLSRKAVIGLLPDALFGKVIWPPD